MQPSLLFVYFWSGLFWFVFAFLNLSFCFLNNMLTSWNKLFCSNEEGNEDGRCEFDYEHIVLNNGFEKDRHNYSTSWGPKGFEKANHTLAIMVCLL